MCVFTGLDRLVDHCRTVRGSVGQPSGWEKECFHGGKECLFFLRRRWFLQPGREWLSRRLHCPNGRLPGREAHPVSRGAGIRVQNLPRLLQARNQVHGERNAGFVSQFHARIRRFTKPHVRSGLPIHQTSRQVRTDFASVRSQCEFLVQQSKF